MSKNRRTRLSSNFVMDNHSYTCLSREGWRCSICRPHRGCNARWKYRNHTNWKKQRKTQWKVSPDLGDGTRLLSDVFG